MSDFKILGQFSKMIAALINQLVQIIHSGHPQMDRLTCTLAAILVPSALCGPPNHTRHTWVPISAPWQQFILCYPVSLSHFYLKLLKWVEEIHHSHFTCGTWQHNIIAGGRTALNVYIICFFMRCQHISVILNNLTNLFPMRQSENEQVQLNRKWKCDVSLNDSEIITLTGSVAVFTVEPVLRKHPWKTPNLLA